MFGASSVLIRFKQLDQIWLFNCFEGCQHVLSKKKVRIAQIKKIIIMRNDVRYISGLLGLLSTISLNTESFRVDVYAPRQLHKCIFLARRYSKTNFRYKLYLHDTSSNITIRRPRTCLYPFTRFCKTGYSVYTLISSEQPGIFHCKNAKKYSVPLGYLYSCFKAGQNFILPDGQIIYGKNFVYGYYLGAQIALMNFFPGKLRFSIMQDMTLVVYC